MCHRLNIGGSLLKGNPVLQMQLFDALKQASYLKLFNPQLTGRNAIHAFKFNRKA